MNQRLMQSGYPRIANDDYKTIDPRCTYAFLEHFRPRTAVDVCAPSGSGIVDTLQACGVEASGLHDAFAPDVVMADWVVSNPPYKPYTLTNKIIWRQLERMRDGEVIGVAMFMRWGFDFAATRRLMFALNDHYYGQVKTLFRPKWIEPEEGEEEHQPYHPYVWHIWRATGRECRHPVTLYSTGEKPK